MIGLEEDLNSKPKNGSFDIVSELFEFEMKRQTWMERVDIAKLKMIRELKKRN